MCVRVALEIDHHLQSQQVAGWIALHYYEERIPIGGESARPIRKRHGVEPEQLARIHSFTLFVVRITVIMRFLSAKSWAEFSEGSKALFFRFENCVMLPDSLKTPAYPLANQLVTQVRPRR